MTLEHRRVTLSGNVQPMQKARRADNYSYRPGAGVGWRAAMLELEHQAEHWDTPEHGETGHLIAEALRAAVDIARAGGLKCEHRVEAERNGSHAVERTPLRMPEAAKRSARTASTRAS